MKKSVIQRALIVLSTSLLFAACGEDDASTDDPLGIVSAIGNASSENGLADAYPHSLAMSMFPTSVTADSLGLAEGDDVKNKSTLEKRRDTDEVLRGSADRCFKPERFDPFQKSTVTCYEFDNDMNPFNNGPAGEGGTTTGTHTDGEACLVAFTREEVSESIDEVERALSLVAAMICQAKKDGENTEPPAADEKRDLKGGLDGAAGDKTPITTAEMERLPDVDSRPVYASRIEFRTPDGATRKLTLVHSPGATKEEDAGTLFLSGASQDPQSAGKNHVLSIQYSGSIEDGEPRMRMQVQRARIKNDIDPVNELGEINYSAIPEADGNDTSDGFSLTEFDINPDTNEGNFSYWRNPGGNYNERARGFLFTVNRKEDGALEGCGVSGAAGTASDGISIRKSKVADPSPELKPTGYWHPFAGGNTAPNKDPRFTGGEGNFFTKQCFSQNVESGLYEVSEAHLSDEDADRAEAETRGYAILPSGQLDVERPRAPRRHELKDRN